MNKGLIISGAGHLGLILWALLGGWLFAAQEVPEIKVADVSLISTAEFDAMVSAAPKVEDVAPVAVAQPATAAETVVATPAPPDPVAQTDPPPPPSDTAPAVEQPPEMPVPPDPVPVVAAPQIDLAPPPVAPPTEAVQPIPVPRSDVAPQPRPVEKIADVPVDQVPVTPKVADTPTPKLTDSPTPDLPVPPKPETAPEVAAIAVTPDAPPVTEPAPQLAPTSSKRPQSRPKLAAAQPPAPTASDQTAADKAAVGKVTADKAAAAKAAAKAAADKAAAEQAGIAAAVAAASQAGTGGTGDAPLGPTLNSGEVDNLRRVITRKWNIGALSTEASQVLIVVAVTLSQDQKPSAIQMISFKGGSEAAAKLAFTAAKSAIYRAAAEGFNLPVDKYDDWKDLELTFDPTTGSLR